MGADSLNAFSSEALNRLKSYAQSTFSGIEIALLATFILLLANALFFDPPTGFKTKLLPNVDIDQREVTRLYAAALGLFLCVRLVIASRRYTKTSIFFWATAIMGTIAANIGVVILATSSIFAFTILLVPLLLLVSIEFWFLWKNRPTGFFRALLPSGYLICATLWFLNILLAEHSFRIEATLPLGTIELVEDEIEEMLAGRDPCMRPSADIVLTPFGYWTFVRTSYDTTCGADGLVRELGADTVAALIIVNEWMDATSVSAEDVEPLELFQSQLALRTQLEERGEAILETASGRIILQSLEHELPLEPLLKELSPVQSPEAE